MYFASIYAHFLRYLGDIISESFIHLNKSSNKIVKKVHIMPQIIKIRREEKWEEVIEAQKQSDLTI